MKRFIWLTIFALLCGQAVTAAPTGQDLLLFYSNDVQGETEPCGCQSNQQGGLSKKGFQLDKIAAAAAKPHLTLDAGNLLFKQATVNPSQAEQEKMAARALVEAYALSGYQAVAVGTLDLSAGLDFLRTVSTEAKFSWLSANLVDPATRKPIFQPSITLQAGAVKTVIIGLTGPANLAAGTAATILPWDQVLPALLDQAASQAALIILLSNLPVEDNQRIAETYDAIQLIIQSRPTDSSGPFEPVAINNTVLVSTAPQGKQVGIMEVNWQPSKRWGDPKDEALAKKKAALDSLLWQLSKYQRAGNSETALRDQPDQLKAYQLLREREQTLRHELDGLSKEISSAGAANSEPSSYRNRVMAMEDSLPGKPEIVALFDRLDRALNQLGQEKAKTVPVADSPYLGSQACGPCHADQLAAWQKTKHAKAYTTLVDKKQQFNTNCLPCHVTGVPLDKADEALAVPEHRRGVGCETCHGPGRSHVKDPRSATMVSKPEPALCRSCHAPPHDTTFDYERNSKLVH